jgi:hypothetical protein
MVLEQAPDNGRSLVKQIASQSSELHCNQTHYTTVEGVSYPEWL